MSKPDLFADIECWEFKRAHPEEFASYGCGPGKIGDWLVPDTVYGLSIRDACRIHDWDTRHGSGVSKEHRKLCDVRFKDNMFIIVKAGTDNWFLLRVRLTRCRFYFWMVRSCGKNAYWGERNSEGVIEPEQNETINHIVDETEKELKEIRGRFPKGQDPLSKSLQKSGDCQ